METSKFKSHSLDRVMFEFFMALLGVGILASCSDDEKTVSKSPVVFVHGAWQADYVWEQTEDDLETEGYKVTAVNLLGHGDDTTPAAKIGFRDYVNAVKAAISEYDEPVVLVGHSLGGAIITQAATEVPQKISKLVYVAGFIPESGKTTLDYSLMDHASLLPPALEFSPDHTLAGLKDPEINLPAIFCQDGTKDQKQFLLENYKAEPTAPLSDTLKYKASDYAGAGKKYYIYTTEDKAITYSFQQQMAAAAGVTNIYRIVAGHSPFISKQVEFTAILKEIFNK